MVGGVGPDRRQFDPPGGEDVGIGGEGGWYTFGGKEFGDLGEEADVVGFGACRGRGDRRWGGGG